METFKELMNHRSTSSTFDRAMKIRKLFVLTLALTSIAEARIKESVNQCEQRYGKALLKKGKMHVYEKAGLRIGVIFHNGVSHSIAYWKAEKDAIEQPLKLSDKEVEVLLNSNKTNSEWKEIEANRVQTLWYTKDDKLIALN